MVESYRAQPQTRSALCDEAGRFGALPLHRILTRGQSMLLLLDGQHRSLDRARGSGGGVGEEAAEAVKKQREENAAAAAAAAAAKGDASDSDSDLSDVDPMELLDWKRKSIM